MHGDAERDSAAQDELLHRQLQHLREPPHGSGCLLWPGLLYGNDCLLRRGLLWENGCWLQRVLCVGCRLLSWSLLMLSFVLHSPCSYLLYSPELVRYVNSL